MTLRYIPQAFTAALCLLLASQTATAQQPSSLHSPGSAAISPDGKSVAWTLRLHEGSTLHLTDLADSKKDTLITPAGATNCSNTAPVWSPDATTLAFTSTCTGDKQKPDQEQIFLWTAATGEIKQLTHLTGNIEQAAWSPDGKSLAFLFVENATRSAGALDAMKPWSGVIGEDGVEIQRVYGVNVSDSKGGFLTPTVLHVYEFAFAPNSHEIAFIAANPPGENNWWVAKLYTIDVSQPVAAPLPTPFPAPNHPCTKVQTQCLLFLSLVLDPTAVSGPLHGLQIAVPRWSPDGKRIALIGGLMSDQGSTGGDVWVVDANGKSAPFNVTPNIDGTPVYEAWLDDNKIGMVEDRRGRIVLPDYDVTTRTLVPNSTLDMGEVSLSGGPIKDAISFTPYGQFAFVQSSLTHAPEVYAGPLDKLRQLTHLNDGLKPTSKTESIEWDNEGFHVQGWLTYPKNYDPSKKYPLIVSVHGGPSASIGPRWAMGDTWADAGYFEFQPNPRGSFGQGEAFTKANIKDFGYGDLRDILKGMDAIEAKVSIDKTREGLTGWSYGGFMTMFAVTQTHRFRAAVAGAGLSDWLSYYGENSIDQWMIPFFGVSVYDDPAIYAKSSAITFIKNVTTPTLVIVGDRDGECPAPQSFEFWHALRDLGVKTQLVVYPNEGHGFRDPAHLKDRNDRIQKWFAENMPEKQ
jgi:dipeptidyl aminopeptidase/acylaminoacyl peptidase